METSLKTITAFANDLDNWGGLIQKHRQVEKWKEQD